MKRKEGLREKIMSCLYHPQGYLQGLFPSWQGISRPKAKFKNEAEIKLETSDTRTKENQREIDETERTQGPNQLT
jgi:hypothetical protein